MEFREVRGDNEGEGDGMSMIKIHFICVRVCPCARTCVCTYEIIKNKLNIFRSVTIAFNYVYLYVCMCT